MKAHYPIKVQAIRSKGRTDRYYVFIPLPLAAAIGLEAGELVEWTLEKRQVLQVRRHRPEPRAVPPRRRRT
jgi:hypothetical protein